MDLITIDIGNSTVSLGLFVNDQLSEPQSFPLTNLDALDDTILRLRNMCGEQPHGAETVPVLASSVNAPTLPMIEDTVDRTLDQRTLLVGRDFPLEMKHAVENPEEIGSDRMLTASAAYEVVQGAVLIADFGSATTLDCVNDMGIFLGGVIMPGLGMAAQSLHRHTVALPEVDITLPTEIYGVNTVSAIQNGIYYAAQGALREVAERYATQLGHWPQIVATGGYSRIIAEQCELIDSLVPYLCLSGLNLAYQKFIQAQEEGLDE